MIVLQFLMVLLSLALVTNGQVVMPQLPGEMEPKMEMVVENAYTACLFVKNSSWTVSSMNSILSWLNSVQSVFGKPVGDIKVKSLAKQRLEGVYSKKAKIRWSRHGPHEVDGWLYQEQNLTAYLYDDLNTAIIGKFKDGYVVSGKASKVIRQRYTTGVKCPEICPS